MGKLTDCLRAGKFSSEDAKEIRALVRENGGDEVAGVKAYLDLIADDVADLRNQLADAGFDLGERVAEGLETGSTATAPDEAKAARALPQAEGGADAITYLASRGGLRDDEGHGLVLRRNLQRLIPFYGSLIRKDGNSIDAAGEILWDAGYFGPTAETARPTENQVLNFIEKAFKTKTYLPEMQAQKDERTEDPEQVALAQREELNQIATEYGLDPDGFTTAELQALVDKERQSDADFEAQEREAIQAVENELNQAENTADEESIPFGEGTASRPENEGPRAPDDEGRLGQDEDGGGTQGGTDGGEVGQGGPGPREPDAGQAPPQEEDGVEPPEKVNVLDVGERLGGARKHAFEQLDAAMKAKTEASEQVKILLEETSRSKLFPINLDPEASNGTRAYLERVRGKLKTFLDTVNYITGGQKGSTKQSRRSWRPKKRSPVEALTQYWSDDERGGDDAERGLATRKVILKAAAEYTAFMQELENLTKNALTIKDAELALARALIVDYDASLAKYDAETGRKSLRSYFKLTELGNQLWGFEAKGNYVEYWFHPDGSFARDLVDDMADDDTGKAKPLRAPKIDNVVREGLPERRPGNKNVTPEDFMKTFGFRGVQFGNYVNQEEGMRSINAAYDALLDLADTLNIDPKNIGFAKEDVVTEEVDEKGKPTGRLLPPARRHLGIAFGARGQGGKAAAHYEPSSHVINITKNSGDGSLAHEWLHALDFALRASKTQSGRYTEFVNQIKTGLQQKYDLLEATSQLDRLLTGQAFIQGNKRRGPIQTAEDYISYLWKSWNKRQTNFMAEAKELGAYWKDPVELWARAGESAIYDMIPGKSPYLVSDWVSDSHVTKAAGYRGTPYPSGDERLAFTTMFSGLFNALRFVNGEVTIDDAYQGPSAELRRPIQEALDEIGKDLPGRRERLMGRKSGDNVFDDPEARKKRYGTPSTYYGDDTLNRQGLGMAFAEFLEVPTNSFPRITDAQKMAEDLMGAAITKPQDMKALEEAVELGSVLAARRIFERMSQDGASHGAIFQALVDLYQRQPPLLTRTSNSAANQAYSTPVPIAYLTNVLAGITPDTTLYEPTAGQGVLAMTATSNLVFANEFDPARAKSLTLQGFQVSTLDALLNQMSGVDRVIANPPFGNVKDEQGNIRVFKTAKFDTNAIDHAISLKALESMKEDGRAVLIIAGQKHLGSDPDGKKRQALYNSTKNRAFFSYLYDTYKVTEHFTIDGALYKRQGAAWPIDIIVIHGRGKTEHKLPGAQPPKTYDSFDELKSLLNGTPHGATERELDTEALGLGTRQPAADAGGGMDQGPGTDTGGVDERPGSPRPGPDQSGTGGGATRRPRPRTGGPAGAGSTEQGGMGGDPVSGGPGDQGNAEPEQPDVAGAGDGQRPGDGSIAPGSDARGLANQNRDLKDLEDFDDIFDNALGGTQSAPALDAPAIETPRIPGVGPVDAVIGWQPWDPRKTYTPGPGKMVRPWTPRRLEDEKAPPTRKPKGAGEAAKDAAVGAAKGLVDSMDALGKLFGADPTRLTSGIGFDPETYKKAKPLFISSLSHFKGAALDVKQMAVAFINHARTVMKWADDVIMRMKPYLKQFITDALAGDIPGFGKQRERSQNNEIETTFQVRYEPASKMTAVGTLIPSNMRTAVIEALESAAQRHGDLDTYVAKALGMSLDEMEKAFSAEQVDALALAIDNVESGKGFIIGDQTGVGKGRFVAGMIKYALHNNITPIFVTQNPKLYADMYRDTSAIGMKDTFKPLMTNKGEKVTLEDESVVRSLNGDRNDSAMMAVADTGRLPDGYNVLMTTYSQLQTVKGKKEARHLAVDAIASSAMMILDESHEAGGTEGGFRKLDANNMPIQSRSEYIRELIAAAKGTVYSSATYAKNPHVMTLYFKTDMADAVEKMDDLTETIKRGGVPLQQVVANMLVKAGQYLRRERSFDGVKFGSKKAELDMPAYRAISQRLRQIFELDMLMTEAREAYGDYLNQSGEALAGDNAVGDTGVTSATFSSMMHNVINQSLMALKADAAAQEAIDAWKAGKKPIIALSSTLGSFLDEHITENNLKTGSKVEGFNFNQLFIRYLKRTRTVSIKDKYNPDKKTKHYITDGELEEIGHGHLIDMFDHVANEIEGTDLSAVPASPIDYMLEKMAKAGMKVDEITGRGTRIVTRDGVAKLTTRDASNGAKGRIVNGYNAGTLDGLILNRSGSTGLSLHASKTFKDKKTRLMILMQADANIDIFMQMLGRIHRTGQVVPPEYVLLSGDVPAERRPAAITAGKMKSLNANTSANSDSAFSDSEAVDFMNKYGDDIVAGVLVQDPEMARLLDIQVAQPTTGESGGDTTNEGIARKATGRAAILLPEEQQEFLDTVVRYYVEHIARLDALGENALVAKTRDLKATTLQKFVLVPGRGEGTSPFLDAAYLERIEMTRQGRPYGIDEIQGMVTDSIGDKKTGAEWFKDREAQQKGLAQTIVTPLEEAQRKARDELDTLIKDRREFGYLNGQPAAQQKFGPLVVAAELKLEKASNKAKEAIALNNTAMTYLWNFQPGRAVKITIGTGEDSQEFMGIVLDHTYETKTKNPLALSNSTISIAVADAVRELHIPYSQIANERYKVEVHDPQAVRGAFSQNLTNSRETRWMITGNLLSGFNTFRKGQMTIYTDDAGNVRDGILMSPKFDPQKELDKHAVVFKEPGQVVEYLKAAPVGRGVATSSDGVILITRDTSFDYVIKIKPKGGRQYFVNPDVIRIIGQFVQKGGKGYYTAKTAKTDKLTDLVGVLANIGDFSWQTDQMKDIAKKITGEKDLVQVPVERAPGAALYALKRQIAANRAATEQVTVYDENNNPVLADQYVVPGAEQSPEQKAQAERARTKAALELMAKQSKMRTGKAQEDPGGMFGDTKPKQGTLFAKGRGVPPVGQRDPKAMRDLFVDRLKQMDPSGRLAVNLVKDIDVWINGQLMGSADGQYLNRLITLALAAPDMAWTLDHEIVHGMRDLGVIRPAEWAALVRTVKADPKRMKEIDQTYRAAYTKMFPANMVEDKLLEEAVADLHADFKAGTVSLKGFERSGMQRITDFLRAVWEVLTLSGFRDGFTGSTAPDAILNRLSDGTMGRRGGVDGMPSLFEMFAAAWHGTPHEFDEFSTDKIDTGEGAQAYGWGLYFAGAKAVADHYRKSLSAGRRDIKITGTNQPMYEKIIDSAARTAIRNDALTTEGVVTALRERSEKTRADAKGLALLLKITPDKGDLHYNMREHLRNAAARADIDERLADEVEGGKIKVEFDSKANGRLFKVELAPKEDEYLMWDLPASEQSAKVQEALKAIGELDDMTDGGVFAGSQVTFAPRLGGEIYQSIANKLGKEMMLGTPPMQYGPTRIKDDRAASLKLKELGVRGVKYKDGFSRQLGDDATYNYVIFDDKDVTVVEKFSLRRNENLDAMLGAISANFSKAGATEEDEVGISANMGGMIKLFGERMYDGSLSEVTFKELLQNSWDAVKGGLALGHIKPGEGRVDIIADEENRTITFIDNGAGMTPEIVKDAFLTLAGTDKEALEEAMRSGGLGLAKLAFLFGNKTLKLLTVRDGVATELDTSGAELIAGKAKRKITRGINAPNGTTITIELPKTYTKNGEVKDMPFSSHYLPGALEVPLVGDIEVTYESKPSNGSWHNPYKKVIPIGRNLDLTAMPKVTTAHFPWGDVEIYMSEKTDKYMPKHTVLSSGIFQFDSGVMDGPVSYDKIPYDMIFNVLPKVNAHHQDYPFNNQREDWNKSVKEDVKAMKDFFMAWSSANNADILGKEFANVQIMPMVDAVSSYEAGKSAFIFRAGDLQNFMPTQRTGGAIPSDINVKNGQLDISIPDMVDTKNFSIDQQSVPTYAPLFESHLNVDIVKVAARESGIPEQNLRYVIARLGSIVKEFANALGNVPDYGRFNDERAVGISLDKDEQGKGYQGVNITVPYKSFFINPFGVFTHNLTRAAAIAHQINHTMMHEAVHEIERNHNASYTTEMARLYGEFLEWNPDLDPAFFQDRLEELINEHRNAWDALKAAFDDPATKNVANIGGEISRSQAEGRDGRGADGAYRPDAGTGTGGLGGSRNDAQEAAVGGVAQEPDGGVGPQFSLRRTATSPAFADFSEEKIRRFAAQEQWGAVFTRIDAKDFIDLTTPPSHRASIMTEPFKTSNIEPYDDVQPEFDPADFDLEAGYAVPYLRVDDNGNVTGHEGRHRAAALLRAGAKTMPIALTPHYRAAWKDTDRPPRAIHPQDHGSAGLGTGVALIGNYFAHVPRHPTQEQVDAAMKLVGPQSNPRPPGGKGPMFSLRRNQPPAPTFFSALTKGVEGINQGKGPAAQWSGIIDNLKNKGVKAEEIEWSGVKEWLAEQKGPVTKDALVEFLRSNEVQIEEVVKGKPDPDTKRIDALDTQIRSLSNWPAAPETARNPEDQPRLDQLLRDWEVANGDGPQRTREEIENTITPMLSDVGMMGQQLASTARDLTAAWRSGETDYVVGRLNRLGVAEDEITRFAGYAKPFRQPAVYGNHVMPGGQDYRELLLTLPRKTDFVPTPAPEKLTELPEGYEYLRTDEDRAFGLTMDAIAKRMGYGGWTSDLTEQQKTDVELTFAAQELGPVQFNQMMSDYNEKIESLNRERETSTEERALAIRDEVAELFAQKTYLKSKRDAVPPPTPRNNMWAVTPPGQIHARPYAGKWATKEEAKKAALERYNEEASIKHATQENVRRAEAENRNTFVGAHFRDTKNILGWVRFNVRTDADGKRVLFIEEIQSDWAQRGRRDGFTPTEAQAQAAAAKIKELRAEQQKHLRAHDQDAYDAVEEQIKPFALIASKRSGTVPSGPFVGDTSQWAGLVFKRALRWAVENGFERVAWTTGEMQAARYDLSKQVSELSLEPAMSFSTPLGYYHLSAKDTAGRTVIDDKKIEGGQSAVADAVGKEVAERFFSDENHAKLRAGQTVVLSGLDLKVGGAGMKGFYDKILPAFVSKYVKKWGAKVGTTDIGTETDKPMVVQRGESYALFNEGDYIKNEDGNIRAFRSKDEANDWISDNPDKLPKLKEKVHSVDVTPAMVESVQQGQPLFAIRRPAGIIGGQNFQALDEENAAVAAPLIEALRTGGPIVPQAVTRAVDDWRTRIQDRFLPLLRLQQSLEEHLGRPLTEEEDVYRNEERSYGRKGAKMDDLAEDHVRPLFEEMQRTGVSVDELELYLYARHAPERNARISSINPKFNEGEGSGMTDAEADDIMSAALASGKLPSLESLASRVDAIRDATMEERVAGGLLSEDVAEKWAETYENYVPLRGQGELDPELESDRPKMMQGISVRGPESRRAFGRTSKATDILAYTIMQAQEAIIRSETNRVATAFHTLAVTNPMPEFWKVDKITMKPVFNSTTGEVEYRASRKIAAEDADYTVSMKIEGVEHRVTLNRKNRDAVKLAEAMRSLKPEQMNGFIETFGKVNRFLSTVNTTLNYEFVITNALRDMQTAMVNINQYDVDAIVKNTAKNYLPALKAATKGAFHNFEGEWGGYYKEFRDAGGRVYFNTVEDLAQQRKSIQQAINDAKPGLTARKAVVNTFRFIENVNNGVENAIRLAAYRAARQGGMSTADAASLAKNLTVNFNRRGSYGPLINSLYLFFNAAVQGTTTMMLAAARSGTVRKVLGAAVVSGALVSILNAMVSGMDDDDESFYDKITEFDKSRNIVVFYGAGKNDFFKFPLPYGYNVFFNIGRGMVDLMRGKDAGKVMVSQMTAMLDAFNPLGGAENLLNMVAPTVIDPLIDLFMNKNFAGRPIMPEQPAYGSPIPNSQRFWPSVSPITREFTAALNKLTGGDDVQSGAVDISPEVLDYLFGTATGAAGSSWLRLANVPLKLADPTSEMQWNDWPLARKIKGEKSPWIDRTSFYERSSEASNHLDEYKTYVRTGRTAEAEAYKAEHRPMMELAGMGTQIREMLSIARKVGAAEKKQMEKGEITREQYIASLEARRQKEAEAITLFNRNYLAVKKRE